MKRALALLLLAACDELPQLSPAAPDGGQTHVPGTYHAARLSPGHQAHLALTGEKQLSCRDCHFIADAGFSAAAVKPCAACHEKQQEHHHPFDGGVAMTCFSCHGFLTTADKWGCAGCHVEPREGAPHVSVHTEKCEACHRPHGTPFTAAADCGQCHDVKVSHGRGEKALPADTCMTCHPPHTAASVAVARCTGCHLSGGALPAKAQVKPGALFEKGHVGCGTCHAGHAFTATAAKNCSSCHEHKPVIAAEQHVACITCHRPHEDHAAPRPCESCHVKVHVQHPADTLGRPCIGCHPPHAPDVRTRVAVPCITCHQKPGVVHAASIDCRSCHVAQHAGKPLRAPLCVTCHEKQVTLVKTNKGHQNCDACHEGLPHGAPVAPKACLTCHEKKQPPQKGHAEQLECKSCHQSHSAAVTTKCTDCHDTAAAPLPGLHRVAKHHQCSTCHAPHTPQPGFGPQTCRSCHVQVSSKSHPTPPQQCIGCHLFGKR